MAENEHPAVWFISGTFKKHFRSYAEAWQAVFLTGGALVPRRAEVHLSVGADVVVVVVVVQVVEQRGRRVLASALGKKKLLLDLFHLKTSTWDFIWWSGGKNGFQLKQKHEKYHRLYSDTTK